MAGARAHTPGPAPADPAAERSSGSSARARSFTPPPVARGGLEALVFRIAEVSGQVVMVLVTARFLEPAGRGLYALASLTATLCSLPLGSVWTANAIEVAKRRTPLQELLGASMAIALVGGAATALAGFGVAALVGERWWVVAFPAATAPMILLARYGEGLFQALGHVRAVNLITVGRVLLPLALITPALVAGAGARTAIGIWTLWLVLLPVFVVLPLRRLTGRERLPRERGLYRRLVATGAKLSVANTALTVGPRVALIALAAFAAGAAVGVYSVALAAADVIYLTTYSLGLSVFHGIASRDREPSIELTARSIRHALLLALGAGAVLIPTVAIALPTLIGPGYHDVTALLAILMPGVLGASVFWALHTFLAVQLAQPAIVTRIALVGLAVNAGLCLALVPPLGLWGAALATTTANALLAAMALRSFRAVAAVPARDLVPGRRELADYAALARPALVRLGMGRARP
jgi:O-antigen/teichoic acid export membrane protein